MTNDLFVVTCPTTDGTLSWIVPSIPMAHALIKVKSSELHTDRSEFEVRRSEVLGTYKDLEDLVDVICEFYPDMEEDCLDILDQTREGILKEEVRTAYLKSESQTWVSLTEEERIAKLIKGFKDHGFKYNVTQASDKPVTCFFERAEDELYQVWLEGDTICYNVDRTCYDVQVLLKQLGIR